MPFIRCTKGSTDFILLSSTSPWYKVLSNQSIVFTHGIVFAELNDLALPISMTGAEVVTTTANFEIWTDSVNLFPSDGTATGEDKLLHCYSFNLTTRDIHDFLAENSFTASFFNHIEHLLPDWLSFHPTGASMISIDEMSASLQRGSEIQDGACQGAPLNKDQIYSVFTFGTEFSLSIYGQEAKLPIPLNDKRFCIIVDLCQACGGTVFLVLSDESRDLLGKFTLFKSLMDKYNLQVKPTGIGISVTKHINVQSEKTKLRLWNGDALFDYP